MNIWMHVNVSMINCYIDIKTNMCDLFNLISVYSSGEVLRQLVIFMDTLVPGEAQQT